MAAAAAARGGPSAAGEGVRSVDLPAFTALALERLRHRDPRDEVRQLFMAFDVSCNGYLTVGDVQRCFAEAAPSVPEHVVQGIFRAADRDGDGRVGFLDFSKMMAGRGTDR